MADRESPDGKQSIPYFEVIAGHPPYPWQQRCYAELLQGRPPPSIPLPTGSGKTTLVLLHLLALSQGAPLPRRLVYVVDRRAIVDQTSTAIQHWVEAIAAIPALAERFATLGAFPVAGDKPIRIGILRGGLADSGDWRLDPALPTVVVGTVDMVGSRLLFSGYGDGRNRRPLHAGLLGMGTVLILDEAHLSPAFEYTLRTVERLNRPCADHHFQVVTLSATPRDGIRSALEIADLDHPELGPRMAATKHLTLHPAEDAATRRQMMLDALGRFEQGAVLCFVRSAQEAQRLHAGLLNQLDGDRSTDVGLLTGTLRGQERARLTESALWQRFATPQPEDRVQPPVWLIATAAGEVGVDLDADHMIMDLAPLDAVIQRLGRLNRSGRNGAATVQLFHIPDDIRLKPKQGGKAKKSKKQGPHDWKEQWVHAQQHTLTLLQPMPDLAPKRFLDLDPEDYARAATPLPRFATLGAERITLLAATGADLTHPPVAPFLHGLSDQPDPAETQILWRQDVVRLIEAGPRACEEALTLLPPRPREVLKLPSRFAAEALAQMARRLGPFRGIVIAPDGRFRIDELVDDKEGLARQLRYATLVLPAAVGGLAAAGFLDPRQAGKPVDDLADDDEGLRYEIIEDRPAAVTDWVERALQWRLPLHDQSDEDAVPRWWVYARRRPGELTLDADSDLTRLALRVEPLDAHNQAVGRAAERIARALALPEWIICALRDAGAWHDTGKRRRVWQQAAGNRTDTPVAKTPRSWFRPNLLGGYRHEFGSLVDAERSMPDHGDEQAQRQRALTLHLIAAHHGYARPGFSAPRQWDPELPEALAEPLARRVEQRYIALQAHFGDWGLAWLEGLLKCADARVSSGLES